MKYIDADKLLSEIEKRKEERQDIRDSASWNNEYWPESDFYTRDKEDDDILAAIESLQQEQPEVDKMLCSQIWWEEQGWIMIPPDATVEGIDSLLKQVRKKLHEEHPDWDLEKEIEKYCRIYYNCNYPDQVRNGRCSPIMPHIVEAARYFYKLKPVTEKEE